MPRHLQQKIHSEFSSDPAVWSGYFTELDFIYGSSSSSQDFNDHLFREFNRKLYLLNVASVAPDLLITPHDAGFRYIGI